MSDTFITIVSIIALAVLLFSVSVIAATNQNDAITQATVETLLADFVNTVAKEGKVTVENYDDFIHKLYATGNSYNISLEIQKIKPNPTAIGKNENDYYSVFKNQIENELYKEAKDGGDGTYTLRQGERIIARVENTNETFGTQFKNFIFNIMGKDTIVIEATNSALVSTTTSDNS